MSSADAGVRGSTQKVSSPPCSLMPSEMAYASVMGALCAAIAIVAVILPHGGWLGLLGVVPMGLVASQHRLRVLVTSSVAAGITGFLLAGLGGLGAVWVCSCVGAVAGSVKRRGRGAATLAVTSLSLGTVIAATVVVSMAILEPVRTVMLGSAAASVNGATRVLAQVPSLFAATQALQRCFAGALIHWQVLVFLAALIGVTGAVGFGWWVLSRVLERMEGIPARQLFDARPDDGAIAPVPVRLTNVRVRFPDRDRDALPTINMDVQRGEHVAVTGRNGSGKSTLMQVLAGRTPTAGAVERPGAVGLGRVGGTAVVMQHPESQVLGMRVADDVVWGLPPGVTIDVERLLGEVGLAGLGDRDTGALSGGELQRLAVAAALAREPALIVADEVTSMIDQQGRDRVLGVLADLARHRGTALVHITHYLDEAECADRTADLTSDKGSTVRSGTTPETATRNHGRGTAPVLKVIGVGHEYGVGTPWAHTALRDISFEVDEGEGLLIYGDNGSGKSTLGWIMAGLTAPTTGVCLVDQQPASARVGAVACQFQTARLQVMRHRVDLEVASSGGFSPQDRQRVKAALVDVGLDPALADHRVDQLSGGQLRRVVLAGLLARSPRVLILDEPLAGLDAAGRRSLIDLLMRRRRDDKLTLIVISHDYAELAELCPRTIHLAGGSLRDPSGADPTDQVASVANTAHFGRRSRRPLVLLRPVPGDSVVHRLWAGTKLLTVFSMSLLLAVDPTWVAIGLVAAVGLAGALMARIPRTALPSPTRGLWVGLAIFGALAAGAGGAPEITLGTVSVGVGGLLDFLRFTSLSVVLLGLGFLVQWTTNVAEIAPALAAVNRRLHRLRIPMNEWSVALALTLRTFPMLINDFRVVHAAYRLRPRSMSSLKGRIRRRTVGLLDLTFAVIAVAIRRAEAMGDAITARGGFGLISASPSGPKMIDWCALFAVATVCTVVLSAASMVGG